MLIHGCAKPAPSELLAMETLLPTVLSFSSNLPKPPTSPEARPSAPRTRQHGRASSNWLPYLGAARVEDENSQEQRRRLVDI